MDYKEKYEKAVKAAMLAKQDTESVVTVQTLEEIFPELKESEDERIRKEIIAILQYKYENYSKDPKYCNAFKWIAWLEKQGEQPKDVTYTHEVKTGNGNIKALVTEKVQLPKKYEKQSEQNPVIVPKFRVGDTIRHKSGDDTSYTIINIVNGSYLCDNNHSWSISSQDYFELVEQKPADKVEPKFKAGDCIKPIDSCLGSQRTICEVCDGWYVTNQGTLDFEYENNWELVEQKPVEWNEEDEEMLNGIIVDIEVLKGQDTTKDGRALYQKEIDWLKSLKDRVQPQPKQEWSEEDEKLYNDLSDTYFYNDEDYPEETYKLMLKRVLDWMTKRAKSIRPQNRWKPSDEQMNNK